MTLRMRELTVDRMALAYPLVQLVNPQVSFDSWRRYAEGRLHLCESEPGGIMLIEDASEHIAGLFAYLIEWNLQYGRVLAVRDLVVLTLFEHQRSQTLRAIVESLDRLAETHKCVAIHTHLTVSLPSGEQSALLSDHFESAGHSSEPWGFCKLLGTRTV